jgi:hypothetical protein
LKKICVKAHASTAMANTITPVKISQIEGFMAV